MRENRKLNLKDIVLVTSRGEFKHRKEKWKRIKMNELDLARLKNISLLMGWKDSGDGFILRKIVA